MSSPPSPTAAHAGKVTGWVGMALFAACGFGEPAGAWVYARFGFAGIALSTELMPLLVFAIAAARAVRPPFYKLLGAVKLPGLALTISWGH